MPSPAGHGLARQGRHVHLDASDQQPGVRRDPVALADLEQVAGHERARVDLLTAAVADHRRARGHVGAQRLDGAHRLPLLQHREGRVQQDHADDHDREGRAAGGPRECRGQPQKQREGMGQLPRDLAGKGRSPVADQLVGAVDREPVRSLGGREAAFAGRHPRSRSVWRDRHATSLNPTGGGRIGDCTEPAPGIPNRPPPQTGLAGFCELEDQSRPRCSRCGAGGSFSCGCGGYP